MFFPLFLAFFDCKKKYYAFLWTSKQTVKSCKLTDAENFCISLFSWTVNNDSILFAYSQILLLLVKFFQSQFIKQNCQLWRQKAIFPVWLLNWWFKNEVSVFFWHSCKNLLKYTIMHISSISNVTKLHRNKKLHVVGSIFCIQNM